jgi:hypothetical protein
MADLTVMITTDSSESWVQAWLGDFRDCLGGAHGGAWRSRAEQELRKTCSALCSDRQRAASWRRTREDVHGATAA